MAYNITPTDDQKTIALKIIANRCCERVDLRHYPAFNCSNAGEGWTPYAEEVADSWCDPCICAAALEGLLPKSG